MKLKRYLKNLTSLVLILSSCLSYGCSPRSAPPPSLKTTSVEKEIVTSFNATAKIGYPLDISTTISGKTFWIYIATKKDILTLTPASSMGGLTPEKFIKFMDIQCNYQAESMFALDYIFLKYSEEEKTQNKNLFEQAVGGTMLYQDYTDTLIEILQKTYASIGDIINKVEDLNFFAISVANIKKGIKITFVVHRLDMEQFLMGMLPPNEFYSRMIVKTEGMKEIINDRYGLHIEYNDISLVNYLREQIITNSRATIGEMERFEPEKLKSIDKLDDILLKSVYEVTSKYEFDDFLFVEVKNIVTHEKSSISKSKLISRYELPSSYSLEEYNF